MLIRRTLLLACFCLPILGAKGCDDQVNLGDNNDPDGTCEVQDCPAGGQPAIACANGDGEWQCVRQADSCGWSLDCPGDPVSCSPSDCGDATPAIACANGSTNFVCDLGSDNTCRWQLDCGDVAPCEESDCGSNQSLQACASGTDNWVCERHLVTGACSWNLQCDDDPNGDGTPGATPGNPGCSESQCPLVRPQQECATPDTGNWLCVGDGVDCNWELNCSTGSDDDLLCDPSECPTTVSPPNRTCPDGSSPQECLRDSLGVCEWTVVCGL